MKLMNRKWMSCLALMVSLLISGCDERKEAMRWADKLEPLRNEVLKQMDVTPYRREQHLALKAYFAEISDMAVRLSEDQKLVGSLNLAAKRIDPNAFCSKALISKVDWQRIVTQCTKNGLFICTEEARAYIDVITAVKAKLSVDQQARFDQTSSCSLSLK